MSKKRKIDSENINDDDGPPIKKQKLMNDNVCMYNIEYFGGSDKGKKPTMEDRRIEITNLKEIMEIEYFENNNCKLFGVLDGHGGVMVANWLKDNLPIIICKKLIKYHIKNETKYSSELKLKQIQDIQKALHAAFKTADKKILEWIAPMKHEGSTATIVYIENNYIFTANIGDSKAVLCRLHKDTTKITNKLKILLLTKDHTGLQLNEVKRIQNNGGNIQFGRVNNILQITRSFGDPEFKKYGVNATPNISYFKMNKRDQFMVIGSDGLWSEFSCNDAIKFIYDKYNHKSNPETTEVVRSLLAESILNFHAKDNVSAIILRFNQQ